MSQDKIADMLSSIKNARLAGKKEILVPWSRISFAVASVLRAKGYIRGASKKLIKGNPQPKIFISLSYRDSRKAFDNEKRISQPGRRVYAQAKDLNYYNRRLGITIISTSQGVMTAKEAAKKKLGGELICRVW